MNRIFLICVLFLFAALGCNSSSKLSKEKKQSLSHSYFPISEGNEWTYINEGASDETELYKVKIISISSSDNNTTAGITSFPFFSKEEIASQIIYDEQGQIGILKNNLPETFLPNENDFIVDYSFKFGEWQAYVASVTEKVITEDGTYENCVLIHFNRGVITFSASLWLAKGIGIVKWGYFRTNPPTFPLVYYVLKSHTVN